MHREDGSPIDSWNWFADPRDLEALSSNAKVPESAPAPGRRDHGDAGSTPVRADTPQENEIAQFCSFDDEEAEARAERVWQKVREAIA